MFGGNTRQPTGSVPGPYRPPNISTSLPAPAVKVTVVARSGPPHPVVSTVPKSSRLSTSQLPPFKKQKLSEEHGKAPGPPRPQVVVQQHRAAQTPKQATWSASDAQASTSRPAPAVSVQKKKRPAKPKPKAPPPRRRSSTPPSPSPEENEESDEDAVFEHKQVDTSHFVKRSVVPVGEGSMEGAVSSKNVVEWSLGEYLEFFHDPKEPEKTTLEWSGLQHPEVLLEYPGEGASETFSLLKPKKDDEYDSINDLMNSITIMLDFYFEPAEALELFDYQPRNKLSFSSFLNAPPAARSRSGTPNGSPSIAEKLEPLMKTFDRARSKRDGPGFIAAVERFNAVMRAQKARPADGGPSVMMKKIAAIEGLRERLWMKVFNQVYDRAVGPHVDGLKQYKAFSDNVYGELLPKFMADIFKRCDLKPNSVFVDLGSGVGNCVVQTALAVGCESWGFENMPEASRLAGEQLKEAERRFRMWGLGAGKMEVMQADFCDCREVNEVLKRADVVLVNNEVFTPELNHKLGLLFLDLKTGAKVVSLKAFVHPGSQLSDYNKGDLISYFHQGEATYYARKTVSWKDEGGTFYIGTIDRKKLRKWEKAREQERLAELGLLPAPASEPRKKKDKSDSAPPTPTTMSRVPSNTGTTSIKLVVNPPSAAARSTPALPTAATPPQPQLPQATLAAPLEAPAASSSAEMERRPSLVLKISLAKKGSPTSVKMKLDGAEQVSAPPPSSTATDVATPSTTQETTTNPSTQDTTMTDAPLPTPPAAQPETEPEPAKPEQVEIGVTQTSSSPAPSPASSQQRAPLNFARLLGDNSAGDAAPPTFLDTDSPWFASTPRLGTPLPPDEPSGPPAAFAEALPAPKATPKGMATLLGPPSSPDAVMSEATVFELFEDSLSADPTMRP